MHSHSLPFKGQAPGDTRTSNLSFVMRHKSISFLTALTLVLILLGIWQHKAAMVGDSASTTSTAPVPQPPAVAPIVNPALSDAGTTPSSTNSQQSTSTQLNVNNQSIAVPKNGSVHKTIPNVNGNSSVDFSTEHHSEGSGNASSQSSTSIQIHSNGQSEIDVMNSE